MMNKGNGEQLLQRLKSHSTLVIMEGSVTFERFGSEDDMLIWCKESGVTCLQHNRWWLLVSPEYKLREVPEWIWYAHCMDRNWKAGLMGGGK